MRCLDCPHLATPGDKRAVCCSEVALQDGTKRPQPDAFAAFKGNRAERRRRTALDRKRPARLQIADMSPGQLKLEFASTCAFHQCNGARAMGFASRVPVEVLRAQLVAYRNAYAAGDIAAAEAALVGVIDWKAPEELRP